MDLLLKAIKTCNIGVIEFLKSEGIKADTESIHVAIMSGNVPIFDALYYPEFEIKASHFEMTSSPDMLKRLAQLKFTQQTEEDAPPTYTEPTTVFENTPYEQFLRKVHLGIVFTDEELKGWISHAMARNKITQFVSDIVWLVSDDCFKVSYIRITVIFTMLKIEFEFWEWMRIAVYYNREHVFDIIYKHNKCDLMQRDIVSTTYFNKIDYCRQTALNKKNRAMYNKISPLLVENNPQYVIKNPDVFIAAGSDFVDLLEPILVQGNISMLNVALLHQDINMVKYLISRGIKIKDADSSFMVSKRESFDFVKQCLSDKVVNEIDMTRAAIVCSMISREDMVSYIVLNAPNIDVTNIPTTSESIRIAHDVSQHQQYPGGYYYIRSSLYGVPKYLGKNIKSFNNMPILLD